MGLIDPSTNPLIEIQALSHKPHVVQDDRPPLQSLISVHDFEDVARNVFTEKTYAFYSSAATDLISHRHNVESYRKLMLRPRVLRNVRDVSTTRSILGNDSSAPFFVSPAAMARLAHPDGELAIARACAAQNICYIVGCSY